MLISDEHRFHFSYQFLPFHNYENQIKLLDIKLLLRISDLSNLSFFSKKWNVTHFSFPHFSAAALSLAHSFSPLNQRADMVCFIVLTLFGKDACAASHVGGANISQLLLLSVCTSEYFRGIPLPVREISCLFTYPLSILKILSFFNSISILGKCGREYHS